MTPPHVELFNRILARGIRPLLKGAGFAKSGAFFRRYRGDLVDCLQFQRSGNAVPDLNMTVNCGVYVIGSGEVWADFRAGEKPHVFTSSVEDRIAAICDEAYDRWWRLPPTATDEQSAEVSDDITARLRDAVLPWMERFRSARDVGDYLVDPARRPGEYHRGKPIYPTRRGVGDMCEAAVCYLIAGRLDLAHRWLGLAIATQDPRYPGARSLKARIERLVAMGRFPRRPGAAPGPPGEPD